MLAGVRANARIALKNGQLAIEAQQRGRAGVVLFELGGSLDAALPAVHLPAARSYQSRWCILAQAGETSPRMIEVNPPRTMAVPI